MSRRLTLAVSVAAACAVGAGVLAGAGRQPAGPLNALVRKSSTLARVRQWAGSGAPSTGTVPGSAGSALRQAATWVGGMLGTRAAGPLTTATSGAPGTYGGVIPLEDVPIDQLSEWELDLMTTPDS